VKGLEVLWIQVSVDFDEGDALFTGFGVCALPKSTFICEKYGLRLTFYSADPLFNFSLFRDPAHALDLPVNDHGWSRENSQFGDFLKVRYLGDCRINPLGGNR